MAALWALKDYERELSATTLLEELGWMTLQDRRCISHQTFFFKTGLQKNCLWNPFLLQTYCASLCIKNKQQLPTYYTTYKFQRIPVVILPQYSKDQEYNARGHSVLSLTQVIRSKTATELQGWHNGHGSPKRPNPNTTTWRNGVSSRSHILNLNNKKKIIVG